jgi:hypothetical protein
VRLLYPFADRDDRTAVASILSTLIREAEQRGEMRGGFVECPECEGYPGADHGCPTCHGEGRIRRELAGALDALEYCLGDGAPIKRDLRKQFCEKYGKETA